MKLRIAIILLSVAACGIVLAADLKPPAVEPPAAAAAAATSSSTAPAKPAPASDVPATAKTPAKPALPSPTVNVSVVDWAIFVADVSKPEFNARELFRDSLPPIVEDLRTARPADKAKPGEPGPIGVIRFATDGALEADTDVDVQVSYKGGRALGHWPKAKVRSSGLLWQDVRLSPKAGQTRPLPEGSWVESLRSGGLPLAAGPTKEPFLLYDVELAYPMTLQVTGKEGKYSVASGMDAPLRDFTLYKRSSDGHWQTGALESLSKAAGLPATPGPAETKPDEKTAEVKASATAVVTRMALGGRVVTLANSIAGSAATPSNPQTTPTPALPAGTKGTDLTLAPSPATDAALLAPWRAKLATAGVSAGDQELALKILGQLVLDSKRLTAVYRVDQAELDRILPLEIVPQPKKVARIALVVVTGIDPAIGDELDEWIKKLGDPSWKTREAATAEIKKLGIRAKSKLEEAAKSPDTEIAYRAEQLLGTMTSEPDQPNAATGAVQVGGFF